MTSKNKFPSDSYGWLGAFLAAGVLLTGVGVRAATVITPNGKAAVEGNSGNFFPFVITSGSLHYQQVYLASDFAVLASGGEYITQIAFRPDTFGGSGLAATLSSMRFDLSTSHAGPDALSPTFASNAGADDTIVYGGVNGAALSLSSSFTGPVGGPKDFDIIINLTTPFFYNPAAGNLLLDVRNFGGGAGAIGLFDSQNTIGDSVSRLYTTDFSTGVGSATGSGDTIGLVTKFTTVAAPEPGTMVVFGVGAVLMGLCRRWIRA